MAQIKIMPAALEKMEKTGGTYTLYLAPQGG